MICPTCGVDQPAGNRFCEDCGGLIAGPAALSEGRCSNCGGAPSAIDENGFCTKCGCERIPAGRDHLEIHISERVAGVSDRGNLRQRNEDFLALASVETGDVLVVCDGVSSSQNPDEAAARGARAACDALSAALAAATNDNWVGRASITAALQAAQSAVRGVPFNSQLSIDPPETTIVAAVRQCTRVTVGWVGDSRAYLVDGSGARQLTHDHSWMNEVVEAGTMTAEQAALHPHAHSITRTLGGPSGAEDADTPSLMEIDLPVNAESRAWLILCTDGFWEYVADIDQLAVLCSRCSPPADAAALSRMLVAHACEKGGKDNITVAVLAL